MRRQPRTEFRATAGASLAQQARLAASMEAGGGRFLAKVEALERRAKQTKKRARAGQYKVDWVSHLRQLQREQAALERGLQETLERLAAAPGPAPAAQGESEYEELPDPEPEAKEDEDEHDFWAREAAHADQALPAVCARLLAFLRERAAQEQQQQHGGVGQARALCQLLRHVRDTRGAFLKTQEGDGDDAWFAGVLGDARRLVLEARETADVVGACFAEEEFQATSEAHAARARVTAMLQEERAAAAAADADLAAALDACAPRGVEPDPQVWTALFEELQRLVATHDDTVRALEQEFAEGGHRRGRTGGWPPRDHERFVAIHRQVTAARRARDVLMERLCAAFPALSASEVAAHEEWFRATRYLQAKRRGAGAQLERDRTALLARAREQFAAADEAAEQQAAQAAELERLQQGRQRLRKKLSVLRAEHEEAERARAAEEAAVAAARAEREAAEAARLARDQQRRHAEVSAFHARQREAQEAAARAEAARRAAEEAERQRQLVEGAERVGFREHLRQSRLEAAAEEAEARAREEALAAERLQRIAESVPYKDRIDAVQADPLKPTAAVLNAGFEPDDGSVPFRSMHGYDVKTLFKDKRFKVGLALREAGLHQSSYARIIVERMAPRAAAPIV